MSVYKILFHSFIMAMSNVVGITIGYYFAKLFSGINQFLIQVPTAIVISVLLFLVWDLLLKKFEVEKFIIKKKILFYIYTFAFAFSPVLYFPISKILPKVMNEFGQIPGFWMFQLAGNLIIVFIMILFEQAVSDRGDEDSEKVQPSQKVKKTGKKVRKHKKRGSKKASQNTSETPSSEMIEPKEK